jgi:integrating conjugative element membrane protein (TIGR03747 family)
MAPKEEHQGVDNVRSFFWIFRQLLHLSFWLLAMLALALLMDLLAAHFLWKTNAVGQMENLLRDYLDQTTAPELMQKAADATYWLAFGWNGIDQSVRDAANGVLPSGIIGQLTMRLLYENFQDSLAVVLYGAKLFGIRIAMLSMMLPQFGLIIFVAFIDGYVARYIRRECAGPDSASRYHRAKYGLAMGLVPLVVIVWLLAPVSLPMHWLFFPVALLTGLIVRTMVKWYKKYY